MTYVLIEAAAESRKCENYGDGDFQPFCFHKMILNKKKKKKRKKCAKLSFTSPQDRHGTIAHTYFTSLVKVIIGLIIHYAFYLHLLRQLPESHEILP